MHAGSVQVFVLAAPGMHAIEAFQLLDWQRNHRFCGRCGSVAVRKPGEMAMACPECNWLAYPRISPAVMVLVLDGEKMLLGRSPHFKPGVFSALAGFVEPGETLEQCAVRQRRSIQASRWPATMPRPRVREHGIHIDIRELPVSRRQIGPEALSRPLARMAAS